MQKKTIGCIRGNKMKLIDCQLYRETISKIARNLPKKSCKILITGATGLIGSCIVDVLLLANEQFDCDYTVYALGRNRDKLEDRFSYASTSDKLFFVVQDICRELDAQLEFDYIIHAASNADPRTYSLYPAETLLTNIYGATTVLNYAKSHLKARILFTSTFETYGKIEDNDVYNESQYGLIDYNMVRSCYPESKRCAEILFRCYAQEYGVNFSIARLCSIYGPTMDPEDSKAHAQFIRNALKDEDIVLKSEGTQKRTYLSVFDTVSGIFKILFEGKENEAYNVASSNSIVTIAEVARIVAEACGRKVVFDLPDEIEKRGFSVPQNSILDARKLESLGWKAMFDAKQGLELTINMLKNLK